jgi:hypothetical protein
MGKIDEIANFEYLASPDDIFHARVITSGIIEVSTEVRKKNSRAVIQVFYFLCLYF